MQTKTRQIFIWTITAVIFMTSTDVTLAMYDPAMMRFTSRDKVKGDREEPLTLHKYLYCGNEPLSRIDPSGNSMASILVEPIMAGYSVHTFATVVAAVGVMYMSWNMIDYGIALNSVTPEVMLISMMSRKGRSPRDYVEDMNWERNSIYRDNHMPSPPGVEWQSNLSKAGKWVGIATGLMMLTEMHVTAYLGMKEFFGNDKLTDLWTDDSVPVIETAPSR